MSYVWNSANVHDVIFHFYSRLNSCWEASITRGRLVEHNPENFMSSINDDSLNDVTLMAAKIVQHKMGIKPAIRALITQA